MGEVLLVQTILPVRVDIIGDGSGAEVEASLDENGSINRFANRTKWNWMQFKIIPVINCSIVRSIGHGEEANGKSM